MSTATIEQWIPEVQTAVAVSAGGAPVFLPPADAAAVKLHDVLRNKGSSPLYVRALSIDSGAPAAGPWPLRVKIARRGGDVDLAPRLTLEKGYTPNCVTTRIGSIAGGYEYVWRLWRPFLLRRGNGLEVTVGGVPNQTTYAFDTGVNDSFYHNVCALGVQSGRPYRLGGSGAACSSYLKVHQNDYGEDLLIDSFAVAGTVTNPYPLVKLRSDEQAWTVKERPFWLWSDPFLRSRLVFDFMPEGALVLQPGEGVVIDGNVATALTVKVALEAYRRVS